MRIQINKLGLSNSERDNLRLGYVIHFCKHCGTEIVGRWYYAQSDADIEAIEKEYHAVEELKACPVCGGLLSRSLGYFAFRSIVCSGHMISSNIDMYAKGREQYARILHDEDALCSAMKDYRIQHEPAEASKAVDAITAQYESTAPTKSISGFENIKEDTEKLKGYLLKLIQTETSIFSLTSRLKTLYVQRISTDRNAYGSTANLLIEAADKVEAGRGALEQAKKALTELQAKKTAPIYHPEPQKPAKPAEPLYVQPGFFNKKRILAENAARKRAYEQALANYEAKMEQYRQALERREQQLANMAKQQEEQRRQDLEKAQHKVEEAEEMLAAAQKEKEAVAEARKDIATPEKAQKALLDDEIRQAEELLQKAIHCKHQLYNYNIIFGKYRNFVAVSSFYEYLMAGRCTTLEGTNGTYNLYETELRANIVISQLNSVLESLEKIIENQYMIYDSIQSVNASLHRLETTMSVATETLSHIDAKAQTMTTYMEKIASNSDVIAHNTAVTAYYSKINAELTDALGYMIALG